MVIVHLILLILFIAYGAVIWRLRGGAWYTWLGIKLGTILTRIITGALLSVPVALASGSAWILLTLTLATWIGLILAGWGPFMTMGRHPTPPRETYIDIFSRLLGLKPNSTAWDYVGMTTCGVLLFTPMTLSFGIIAFSWWMILTVLVSAVIFATIYLVFSRANSLPRIPGFAAGFTEWAEVVTGALVSLVVGADRVILSCNRLI